MGTDSRPAPHCDADAQAHADDGGNRAWPPNRRSTRPAHPAGPVRRDDRQVSGPRESSACHAGKFEEQPYCRLEIDGHNQPDGLVRREVKRDAQLDTLPIGGGSRQFLSEQASELRGLPWSAVDFEKRTITVRQRADEWGTISVPKSHAGQRTIPMSPIGRTPSENGNWLARRAGSTWSFRTSRAKFRHFQTLHIGYGTRCRRRPGSLTVRVNRSSTFTLCGISRPQIGSRSTSAPSACKRCSDTRSR